MVRQARASGALTACIVNTPDSELAKVAEFPLFIGAGLERSVAATKTYTGSLALAALLSSVLGPDTFLRVNDLYAAADAMETALDLDNAVTEAAMHCADMRECVTLARGFNQATAQEAALKLIETCYVGARAYSGADFQHGPIAQIEKGLACLLFAPEGCTFSAMSDLAKQLKARNVSLHCFSQNTLFLALGQTPIPMPGTMPEWVSPLVYIVPAQLFAYRLALERGSDPDVPRGLNKITMTL